MPFNVPCLTQNIAVMSRAAYCVRAVKKGERNPHDRWPIEFQFVVLSSSRRLRGVI